MNDKKFHTGAAIGITAFVFALFAPGLWRGEIPYFMDIVAQFYPVRFHAARLLHEWQLPLWNRTYYLGTPLLANPQWGLLYPGNWPFFVWPCGATFLFSYPLHIAIGAMGCYWLAWELSRNRAAALTAAAFSACNSWTWAHLAFGAFFNVTAWTAWTVWMIIRFSRTQKIPFVVWGTILWALQLLGGAPQMAWYAALNYGLLGLLLVFRRPAATDSSTMDLATTAFSATAKGAPSPLGLLNRALGGRWGPLLAVLFIGVLGAGLAAPQLLPTAFFIGECERAGGLAWREVEVGTLGLKDLFHSFFGGTAVPEDAETTAFFGVGGVALALLSLFVALRTLQARRKQRDQAEQSPLCANTILALWILLAVDLLFCNRLIGRLLYSCFPLYDNFHDPKRILGAAQVWMCVLAGIGVVPVAKLLSRLASRIAPSKGAASQTDLRSSVFAAILGVALALSCLVFVRKNVDCKMIAASADWSKPPAALMNILKSSANPRFISLDGTGQYSYDYTGADFGALTLPLLSCLHGIEDAQGYDPFIPRAYGKWLNEVNETQQRLLRRHFGLVYADAAFMKLPAPWSAIVCQRKLISKMESHIKSSLPGKITNVTSDGRVVIYQPTSVAPYCRLTRQDGSAGAVPMIVKRGANNLELKVSPCPVAQRLEIQDILMPGWSARVDGTAATFGVAPLMTLMVPAGSVDRIVELDYWPPGLNLGLGMAVICLVALIILLRLSRRKLPAAPAGIGPR